MRLLCAILLWPCLALATERAEAEVKPHPKASWDTRGVTGAEVDESSIDHNLTVS